MSKKLKKNGYGPDHQDLDRLGQDRLIFGGCHPGDVTPRLEEGRVRLTGQGRLIDDQGHHEDPLTDVHPLADRVHHTVVGLLRHIEGGHLLVAIPDRGLDHPSIIETETTELQH